MFFSKFRIFIFLIFCFFFSVINFSVINLVANNSLRIPKIATLDSNKLFAEIKKDVILLQFLANPTNQKFTNLIKAEYEMMQRIEIFRDAMVDFTNEIEINDFSARIQSLKKQFYKRHLYIVNDHIRGGKFRISIKKKIFGYIKKMIDREGYNILIDKSKVLYIDEEFDLTKKLFKNLQDKMLQQKNLIVEEIKAKEQENFE